MKTACVAIFFVCFVYVCKAQLPCLYTPCISTLFTPKGNPICLGGSAETETPEWRELERQKYALLYYPVEVLDVSKAYSCNGFAWISFGFAASRPFL